MRPLLHVYWYELGSDKPNEICPVMADDLRRLGIADAIQRGEREGKMGPLTWRLFFGDASDEAWHAAR